MSSLLPHRMAAGGMLMTLIGVSCSANGQDIMLARCYIEAAALVGLTAVVLPCQPERCVAELDCLDGLVLAGGGDPHPRLWGELPKIGLGGVDEQRDSWEIGLLRHFLAADKPVLGICRGMQIMNVALGGSLWQDLGDRPGSMLHRQTAPDEQTWHDVKLSGEMAGWLGAGSIAVNSLHHQGVRMPGDGFCIGAVADDMLTEGIYMPGRRFCVGVQWHPERLAADAPGRRILAAFAAACGE